MMTKKLLTTLSLSLLALCLLGEGVKPTSTPFKVRGKEYDAYSFSVGDTRIAVRELFYNKFNPTGSNVVSFFKNNKFKLSLSVLGGFTPKAPGKWTPWYSPNAKVTSTDNSIIYQNEYLLPDGTKNTFQWSLSSVDGKTFVFKWDNKISPEDYAAKIKSGGINFFYNIDLSSNKILLDGKALEVLSVEQLKKQAPKKSMKIKKVSQISIENLCSIKFDKANVIRIEQLYLNNKDLSKIIDPETALQGKFTITID